MKLLQGAAAALGTVLALHGAVWAYATERLRAEAASELDALRRAGWVIMADAPRRGGWPVEATVNYKTALVNGTAAGVPVAWSADGATLGLRAAEPGTLWITAEGRQTWQFGHGAALPLTAAAFQLSVTETEARLTGHDLILNLPLGAVEIADVQLRAAGRSLSGVLTGIRAHALPPVDLLVPEAALTLPFTPGPDAAVAAAAWRQAGGTLEVRGLTLHSGTLSVEASGTGKLDAALQPLLDLTARVRGHRAALDGLVQAGVITPSTATAAKAVLGLLTGREPDAPAIVPVRVADGVLSVAGFPLLRVPNVDWTALPTH